jgi:pilus assembly protein Flp/PilA
MKKVMDFFKKEDGQGMVEYGLIIALVAVVLIGALTLLSGDGGLSGLFGDVTTELAGAGD